MGRRLDIKIGDVFERLTVIKPYKNIDTGTAWVCLCSCGVERAFRANYLMSGKSKSCGCFRDDSLRIRQRTHGETRKTREYKAWCNMKAEPQALSTQLTGLIMTVTTSREIVNGQLILSSNKINH